MGTAVVVAISLLEARSEVVVTTRALTILYHDIVEADDDEFGFPGPAAARYKLPCDEFRRHLAAIVARSGGVAVPASVEALAAVERPFLVTVDDGGSSAVRIAQEMESVGYRATFFVTTDRIGTKGFVSAEDIRILRRRGHAIGSHSHTHPYRFSALSDTRLAEEWGRSVQVLSEILGEAVVTASVPGGYFSRRVAATAHASGIQVLFNSEPTTVVATIDGCLVVGRFNVYRGMTAAAAGALAAGDPIALLRQQMAWNTKKVVKTAAAPVWESVRRLVFKS